MLSLVPSAIQEEATKLVGELKSFKAVGGGCINHGGKLSTQRGHNYFLKWNDLKKFPGMFSAEMRGLELLKHVNALKVPKVIAQHVTTQHQFLLLEFIESEARSIDYWKVLGERLSLQHRHTQDTHGLDHDNFIGSLPQRNHQHTSWCKFMIEERLQPQLEMAVESQHIDRQVVQRFERLFDRLRDFIPEEKPSLLHGDLWSGNVIVDNHGLPCAIDPAVYYGNREMEIAFTTLFGGFPTEFYDSYNAHFPLEPGFEERRDLYNLYPLLVHVNLFGHAYVSQVISILKRYA